MIKNKKIMMVFFVCILLIVPSTICVAVDEHNEHLIDKKNAREKINEEYIIIKIIQNIEENKDTSYKSKITYIKNYFFENGELSNIIANKKLFNMFNERNDNLVHQYSVFLLYEIIKYSKNNNIELNKLYNNLQREIKTISDELRDLSYGIKEYSELNLITKKFLSISNDYFRTHNSEHQAEEEDYWSLLIQSRQCYDGYLSLFGGTIDRDVYKNWPKLWRGDTFYEWWDSGKNYLWGERYDSVTDGTFELTNIILGSITVGSGIIGVIFLWAGLFKMRNDFYTIGVPLSSISIISGIYLFSYDFLTLSYYAAGFSNRLFLEQKCISDLTVRIINNTNHSIPNCSIKAINMDAEEQLGQYYDSETEEFKYILDESEGETVYTLFNISKFYTNKKALPPPGNWEIVIEEAPGYLIPSESISITLDAQETHYLTIELDRVPED